VSKKPVINTVIDRDVPTKEQAEKKLIVPPQKPAEPMPGQLKAQVHVGQEVKVRHEHRGFKYTLDVTVTAISSPDTFIGRIEAVFDPGVGEVVEGEVLRDLKGREATFRNEDIISRRT
jgi:hypothetical protein